MSSSIQRDPAIRELKKRARTSGVPLFGAFELTSNCNFDCKMCYIHNGDNQQYNDLSFDSLKKIFDAAYEKGMMFALLTGGECLLRKDFREIYSYLHNKGVILSINTNASLMSNELVDFLLLNRPERIQISLYGTSNDAYERVTGRKAFDRVDHSICMLLDAGLPVEIAVTPSIYMYDDFANILEYIKARKLPYDVSPLLITPRDDTCNTAELSVEQRIEILKIKRKVSGKTIAPPRDTAPMPGCHDDCADPVLGMPCNAGTIRFVIDSNGFMIPCMSIPEIRINALENDFDTCWQYIRSMMKKAVPPSECENCFYKSSCVYCPVHRYDGLFSGRCNKEICKFNQLKYKAGL